MASIFKKLISRELGENNYNKYFFVCQKSIQNKAFDSKEIYNDIYEHLKNKDRVAIKKMQERLNDTMFLAMRICKTYLFSFLFFVGAIFYLLTKDIQPLITFFSILLMSFCFIGKTYQFIVNKYCFIDAQIVLVYKTVLDRILLISEREHS
ncbi:hypothetical protein [Anaerocolumna sp. MB42-C2]|uniref:hypothetical protein n=1 Tax=Anaerocolumna sp. MB42-C2 TaxID=3070997 RepID=UPI0027DF09F6|nr:hypothetical protein [Anaerocolumna sp. MB42-C2]WMJ89560.1 hypothetical protein RBU59_08545 [Anaerocolumna sp. MB42-C2]